MHMIRHEHIASDIPPVAARGIYPDRSESFMSTMAREQPPALIGANREKDDRLSVERTEMRQMFRLRFHADGHGDREVAAPLKRGQRRKNYTPFWVRA